MAAFGFAQLGAAPQWWSVATTVVMVSGGAILVVQGLISAGRRTRGRATTRCELRSDAVTQPCAPWSAQVATQERSRSYHDDTNEPHAREERGQTLINATVGEAEHGQVQASRPQKRRQRQPLAERRPHRSEHHREAQRNGRDEEGRQMRLHEQPDPETPQ